MTHMVIVMHSALTSPVGFLSHVFNISQRYSHPQHKKTSKYFSCVNLMKYLRCQNQGKYLCQTQTAAKNLLCRKTPTVSRRLFRTGWRRKSMHTTTKITESDLFQTNLILLPPITCFNFCLLPLHNKWKNNFNCIIIVYMQHQGHSVLSLEYTVNSLPIQWTDSTHPLFLLPIQQSHLFPISCFQDDELSCLRHCLSVSKLSRFLLNWPSCLPAFLIYQLFDPSHFLHKFLLSPHIIGCFLLHYCPLLARLAAVAT